MCQQMRCILVYGLNDVGFLMRVSAWEAQSAGDPRSEARTKKALRLQP